MEGQQGGEVEGEKKVYPIHPIFKLPIIPLEDILPPEMIRPKAEQIIIKALYAEVKELLKDYNVGVGTGWTFLDKQMYITACVDKSKVKECQALVSQHIKDPFVPILVKPYLDLSKLIYNDCSLDEEERPWWKCWG